MNGQDRHYLAQGYQLPEGMTWEAVAAHRQHWGTESWMVPLAIAGGAIAWGVPIIDGKHLARIPQPTKTLTPPTPR